MNLKDLINQFRLLAKDRTDPPLHAEPDVIDWLNEAQQEACIRGRLLREDAWPALRVIPLTVGTQTYKLHPLVYEIISLWIKPGNGMDHREIVLKSREWMEVNRRDWRTWDTTQRIPATYAIQDDTRIRLAGFVEAGDELLVECYRLPKPMKLHSDEPEIHEANQRKLVQWALHRAFSVPDADRFDSGKSKEAEEEFTRCFGLRPNSDLRRRTRVDVPHHMIPYLM